MANNETEVISVVVGTPTDVQFAEQLSVWYEESSRERGTGIATRTPAYISKKILNGDTIVATIGGELVGFCYIEAFENKNYVSNSGLIVRKDIRERGLAKLIKAAAFNLAQDKYPDAKVFGITTSEAVMRINSELGYIPVPLFKLTQDDEFWNGCQSCRNFDILQRNNKRMCLCTGMLAPSKNERLAQEQAKLEQARLLENAQG